MHDRIKPWQCIGGTVAAEYLYIPHNAPPRTVPAHHRCSRCDGGGCAGRPEIAEFSDEAGAVEDEA